jgi:hypothetical protein
VSSPVDPADLGGLEVADDWRRHLLTYDVSAARALRPRLERLGLISPYENEDDALTARFAVIAIGAFSHLFHIAAEITGLPTPSVSRNWLRPAL